MQENQLANYSKQGSEGVSVTLLYNTLTKVYVFFLLHALFPLSKKTVFGCPFSNSAIGCRQILVDSTNHNGFYVSAPIIMKVLHEVGFYNRVAQKRAIIE
jgi:hypothetical protein